MLKNLMVCVCVCVCVCVSKKSFKVGNLTLQLLSKPQFPSLLEAWTDDHQAIFQNQQQTKAPASLGPII